MKKLFNTKELDDILTKFEALRRSRPPSEPKKLHSWADITPSQLHTHNMLDTSGEHLRGVQLPYCGRCEPVTGSIYRMCSNGYRTSSHCKDCEVPRRRLARLSRAQLPVDAFDASIDEYQWDSQKQYEACYPFAHWRPSKESVPPTMYMYGSTGNGKTTLMYALAKEAVWNGLRVRYITHDQLFDQEKESWNSKGASPFTHWLTGVNILMLDEVGGLGGGGRVNQWAQERSRKMLGAIYQQWRSGDMAVIMASNLGPAQLFSQVFDRSGAVHSRLKDLFPDEKSIEMRGPDRRVSKQPSIWDY